MRYEYEQDPNEGMALAVLIVAAGIAAVVLLARGNGYL